MKKNRRPSARRLAARQPAAVPHRRPARRTPKNHEKRQKQTNTSALSGTLAPPSRGAARPASPDADGPDDISNTGST